MNSPARFRFRLQPIAELSERAQPGTGFHHSRLKLVLIIAASRDRLWITTAPSNCAKLSLSVQEMYRTLRVTISPELLSIVVLFVAGFVLLTIWREPILNTLRRSWRGRKRKSKTDKTPLPTRNKTKATPRTRKRRKRDQFRPSSRERAVPYEEFLGSNEWRSIRKRVLERDGYRCQRCGATQELQVHHLTYERRGRELLSDLTVLCNRCHRFAHRHGLLGVAEQSRRDRNRSGR